MSRIFDLPADYDAWKTRSDRDDGPDDEFEPEPEEENGMEEPDDIVKRLRHWGHTGTPASKLLEDDLKEAADKIERLQAGMVSLNPQQTMQMSRLQHIEAWLGAIDKSLRGVIEALQMISEKLDTVNPNPKKRIFPT